MLKFLKDLFDKEPIPKGYWEIKKAKNGQWYFVLKAPNHKVLLSSETYINSTGAYNGIKSIKKNVNGLVRVINS